MSYLMVREICTHEDYPCCGCQPYSSYPMESREARRLAEQGRVKVLGVYHPPMYFDEICDCGMEDDF